MEDIKQFLINHPLISIRAMEQSLGIPLGTVRIKSERSIPEKFIEQLTKLLLNYGLNNSDVQTSVQENNNVHTSVQTVVQTSDRSSVACEVTKNTAMFKFKSIINNIRTFERVELPIGSTYTLVTD